MANTIKLKNGSGSDPSSSDLVVGEVALRTDGNPKLFTKNDAGSVLEVGLGSLNDKLPLTGGTLTGDLTISEASPAIFLVDTSGTPSNPDFRLQANNGAFIIYDDTNNATRLQVHADGHTDINGRIDANAGIDVTGAITSTGDLTITNAAPKVELIDSGNNPDYHLQNYNGSFLIKNSTDSKDVFKIDTQSNIVIGHTGASLYFNNGFNDSNSRIQNTGGSNNSNIRFLTRSSGTEAQAAIIDSTGMNLTGNLVISGLVDGVDIATRDTLFGGLTSSSGVLTNGVTATTQSASDNSTKVATTAYTDTAISNLVNSAPSTLDTLKELSDALGSDPNFATTVTNSIATKLPLAGGTLTGNLTISNTDPEILLQDTNNNDDFTIRNHNGVFTVRDATNGADRLTIASDGTTDITNNLNVGGVLKTTGNVLTVEGATPRLNLIDTDNNSDFEIGNTNGVLNIADSTNSVNRLRILSNGTVIVTGNLDAEGGVDVTGQTDLNIASNGALTEPLMIRNGGTGAGTDVGMVFFNGNGTSSGAGALAKIKAIDVGSFDADLVFETALKSGFSTGGTVERFRIKSDGNIGIGTDSPGDNKVLVQLTNSNSNDFEVVGGSSQGRTNINLKAGNATSGSITSFRLINSSGTSIGSFHMDNSTDDINIFNGSQGGKIFFHTNESGSSLVKMTITDTGRVGINTASPSEKLEVNGTVKATAFSGDGSALTGVVASGSNANTLDNLDSTQFLRSDTADTASGDITFSGGAGAVTVAAASDIRIAGGTWTGEYTGGIKIQSDGSNSYIQHKGTLFFRDEGSTNNFQLTQSGGLTITGSVTANGGFSGSGANLTNVNATTLDSIDSGSFLRSDAADTATGDITFSDNGQYPVVIGSASGMNDGRLLLRGSSNPYIRFREGNTDKAYIGWHSDGYFRIVNDESGELLKITSGVNGLVFKANGTEYTVYHTGNDGNGSTLDSDLLDGEEGSYYRNASNLNAGTVAAARLNAGSTSEAGISVVGNFGQWQGHSTYNNFNTEPAYWGWNYVNGNTNAPNSTSSQWYRCRLSLGSEYGKGSAAGDYSLEMAIPRFSQASAGVLHVRTIENGAENAWVSAGFPSGTRMIFQQTSAPTGWTKDTTDTNQRALRVVSGSVGSGGNTDFTSAFASRGVSGTIGNTTQGGTIADGGNNTNNASISTNNKTSYSTNNATQGGSIANGGNNTNNGGNNTNSSSISISVNNHTLSTAQMPSHTHRGRAANHDTNSASSQGYPAGNQHNRHRTTDRANNQQMAAAAHDNTGSSNTHNHGLSQNSHSHSINTHSHSINAHSHGFTGSAHSHSMPNHNHSIDDHNHSIDDHNHSFTGSAHNHSFSGTSINMAVRYLDVIIAQKD